MLLNDHTIKEEEFWNRKYEGKIINSTIDDLLSERLLSDAKACFENAISEIIENKVGNGIILDYGCGNGAKSIKYASQKWKILGIDISSQSIEEAHKKQNEFTEYFVMDCERMKFEDNYFDIIFDYGTLSSLDIKSAIPEIVRVLKPSGFLVSIETLGHNPLMNLWRKLNVKKGKRTIWAADHIMKLDGWNYISKYLIKHEERYFGLTVMLAYPFFKILNLRGEHLISLLQKIDQVLFRLKFLRRLAFKSVFVFVKLNKPD